MTLGIPQVVHGDRFERDYIENKAYGPKLKKWEEVFWKRQLMRRGTFKDYDGVGYKSIYLQLFEDGMIFLAGDFKEVTKDWICKLLLLTRQQYWGLNVSNLPKRHGRPHRFPTRRGINWRGEKYTKYRRLGTQREGLDKLLTMYINSPGGPLQYGLDVFDFISYVGRDRVNLSTYVVGQAGSSACFLAACGGEIGHRYASPRANLSFDDVSGWANGSSHKVRRHMVRLRNLRRRVLIEYSMVTLKHPLHIVHDMRYGRTFGPTAALFYGLIDRALGTEADEFLQKAGTLTSWETPEEAKDYKIQVFEKPKPLAVRRTESYGTYLTSMANLKRKRLMKPCLMLAPEMRQPPLIPALQWSWKYLFPYFMNSHFPDILSSFMNSHFPRMTVPEVLPKPSLPEPKLIPRQDNSKLVRIMFQAKLTRSVMEVDPHYIDGLVDYAEFTYSSMKPLELSKKRMKSVLKHTKERYKNVRADQLNAQIQSLAGDFTIIHSVDEHRFAAHVWEGEPGFESLGVAEKPAILQYIQQREKRWKKQWPTSAYSKASTYYEYERLEHPRHTTYKNDLRYEVLGKRHPLRARPGKIGTDVGWGFPWILFNLRQYRLNAKARLRQERAVKKKKILEKLMSPDMKHS